MNDQPDDRYSALDEFANSKAKDKQTLVPAYQVYAPPPSLFHGTVSVIAPRNEATIRQEIKVKAAAAGTDWYYSIPFKNRDGTVTHVEGPTIGLANDLHAIFGNCEVDPWVSGEGPDYYDITARFIDVERGTAMTRVFRQRKGASQIGGNDPRRRMEADIAIGMSKAIRNVICNALQSLSEFAFQEARNALVTRIGHDIERYRGEVSERISKLVDVKRVEAVIGRPVKDWLAGDIAKVIALAKGVTDGMSLLDETFPPLKQAAPSTKGQLDKLAKESEGEMPEKAVEPKEKAAADQPSAAADPKKWDPKLQAEATTKMLQLASDTSLDQEARMRVLEESAELWEKKLEPAYFGKLVKACTQVIKGYMTADEARESLR